MRKGPESAYDKWNISMYPWSFVIQILILLWLTEIDNRFPSWQMHAHVLIKK